MQDHFQRRSSRVTNNSRGRGGMSTIGADHAHSLVRSPKSSGQEYFFRFTVHRVTRGISEPARREIDPPALSRVSRAYRQQSRRGVRPPDVLTLLLYLIRTIPHHKLCMYRGDPAGGAIRASRMLRQTWLQLLHGYRLHGLTLTRFRTSPRATINKRSTVRQPNCTG